jgi:hypothetical protein
MATIPVGLSSDHGSGTFLVDVDALLPAIAAFAIPLTACTAQELPAVKSEPATPGLGHRGLLRRRPYRLSNADPRLASAISPGLGAWAELALGICDDDQDDEDTEPVASSTSDATDGTRVAFSRSVPSSKGNH